MSIFVLCLLLLSCVGMLCLTFLFVWLVGYVFIYYFCCYYRRLLSLGVVYIVIGVTYNRFVRRAKGREQFPNYTFWVACGDRIAVSTVATVVWCLGMRRFSSLG